MRTKYEDKDQRLGVRKYTQNEKSFGRFVSGGWQNV